MGREGAGLDAGRPLGSVLARREMNKPEPRQGLVDRRKGEEQVTLFDSY